MNKIFKITGFISLMLFTFFITEKTALVVNSMDDIMIEINENKSNFEEEMIDSKIENNTIIPGKSSKKVNVNRSYKNMKINGYYSEDLYSFDYTKPKITLEDNKDKYIISGNKEKNMVGIVFIIKNKEDISPLLTTLNNFNSHATFYVNEVNYDDKIMSKIIENGNNIGILTEDYDNMDIMVKKIQKQEHVFCLNEQKDDNKLNECYRCDNYTVVPKIISSTTPLIDIKKKIESGSILQIEVGRQVKKELSTIIIYLKSKGYTLGSLEEVIIE